MSEVRQIDVPDEARAASTLPRIDYADAFVVETGAAQDRTAEEWARAIIEDAPAATRATLQSGWTALGLKLEFLGSEPNVLGWRIRENTPDVLLVGAESRLGMPAELLVRRTPGALHFSTLIEQDNAAVRTAWRAIEKTHVDVVRRLLARATKT